MDGDAAREAGAFPVSAGVLFGLGLGGFFDGIVLHQVLQWHHMLTSAGYPPDSVAKSALTGSARSSIGPPSIVAGFSGRAGTGRRGRALGRRRRPSLG